MDWVIGIVLDLVLVAIVLLFCHKGKKDGFAKTLIGFLGFFIAIILAALLCKPIANFAYTSLAQKPVENAIETAIYAQADSIQEKAPSVDEILTGIEDALENAPEFLKNALALEEKREQLAARINEIYTADITALSQNAAEIIVKPIIVTAVSGVVFILLFFILMLICSLLAKSLKLVNKIPLLGGVNALLGGLIGLLKGIIVVIIINWLLVLFVGDSGNLFGVITPQTIQSSLIMKNLAVINPLNLIFESILAA